ncbi:hypothetical protein M422DRAFT_35202 [Sphaerobolus stellatus SS14]|uniref:Unplaced genomic scaffold SPHSTscaffold_128, whole genome shotgun sequence n=1 Tax=Sphaerobolus stellatus (strain SS14) TaxID=990650 RepID=A0A0C9UH18_SPHS4|nr:hypothetical protein M422DRAFT_35202 [Sphaerobolus stellatus SS14]
MESIALLSLLSAQVRAPYINEPSSLSDKCRWRSLHIEENDYRECIEILGGVPLSRYVLSGRTGRFVT